LTKGNLHQVFIGIGSNLGDRAQHLRDAIDRLDKSVSVIQKSSVYETPPWGVTEQPAFLNQVIHGETQFTPLKLLNFLKSIERTLGRTKSVRYGPRVIDLDILLYDDRQVNHSRLVIPHPRMTERAFVLVPLAEIASGLVIPGTGQSVQEWRAKTDTTGIKRYSN
jgi:2-amino-4-hydroxy-6-hydroxymethyldihydropteridine diphosphokinase